MVKYGFPSTSWFSNDFTGEYMQEKWKKFLFRVAGVAATTAASYLTSVDLVSFAWKALVLALLQSVLPLVSELPKTTAGRRKVKLFRLRKYLSRL